MGKLFPEIQPNHTQFVPVEGEHELYVEESGNPQGLPVLFVHGGPGAGCEPYHRRFFDPEIYRIILFDQRGAGRSRPHASIEQNTTQALVSDIEVLRERLNVDRWVLFGGSWGSTLSLVYAQTHPARVLALVLRGIFLCRRAEIEWFYQDGANHIFPDYWQDFLAPIPDDERYQLLDAYYKRLTGSDEIARMAAAKAWSMWEGRCATLYPTESVREFFGDPHVALSLARIEAHYFKHDSFLAPNQILRDVHRITNIPGVIVHGRYDVICPVKNAFELHRLWRKSELFIVPDAGHAATEPSTVAALVRAMRDVSRFMTHGNSS
ncbi:MAG: prolyl aminopeptidase [Gammaproteobacteria bacterium]|nr:prolyl aminopeptidase [Gammaproteobacteria bacterium]